MVHIVASDSQELLPLILSCISLEQEVHWTILSLSVFDILSITGRLVPRAISSWRGLTCITDDFDDSFVSGYHSGPTIISLKGISLTEMLRFEILVLEKVFLKTL